jgi:hypothetical protein
MGIVALEQFVPIRFYGMLARRVALSHRASNQTRVEIADADLWFAR